MNLSTDRELAFGEICVKSIVVHTVTYFVAGVLALVFLQYDQEPSPLGPVFRGVDHPLVMAGPLFQVVRGVVFATVFYLLRHAFFATRRGWLVMFWMLAAVGILSTFGPPPGSIEGMIYTTLPISITNYVEVVPQALALSFLLAYWVANPQVRWFTWLLSTAFVIVVVLITLGLVTQHAPPSP